MPPFPFDLITLTVFAVGGLLRGLVEVVLRRRRGAPAWRLPLVLAGVFALTGGLCLALGQPAYLWQSACLLMGIDLVMALTRSPLLPLGVASRPLVQGLLLSLGGTALLCGQVVQIERDVARELARTDYHSAQFKLPIDPSAEPALIARTDTGRAIPLFEILPDAVAVSSENEVHFFNEWFLNRKAIQTDGCDVRYNCHGWIFAAGRYWLVDAVIEDVLEDNGYQVTTRPQPGDLAIFRHKSGVLTHSGLVCALTTNRGPLIESKWGKLGRYIHTAQEHCYPDHTVSYHRTQRGSHLLRGLESAKGTKPYQQPMP